MTDLAAQTDTDWKDDPQFLSAWKATKRRTLEEVWQARYSPLFHGVPLAARRDDSLAGALAYAEKTILEEGETLSERARRLEEQENRGRNRSRRSKYSVQGALGKDDAGRFVIAPWANAATLFSLECAKALYERGAEKKAQRRLACTVLWAKRSCPNGHQWRVPYGCGGRYCPLCGPRRTRELLAELIATLTSVVKDIRTRNRSAVVASIDFTWPNTGQMPSRAEIQRFNRCIKKCFRILEKRFKFTRQDYGVVFSDEFGGSNSNLHAHCVYVGPWIPQSKRSKQLSKAWAKATGGIARIASIKLQPDLPSALAHAVKYSAKYVELSTPQRLAELEVAFHGVRRIHRLARFHGVTKTAAENQLDFCLCPLCRAPLGEIGEWVPQDQLRDVPGLEEFVLRQRAIQSAPRSDLVPAGPGPPG
jgi:hypothetical protein